MAFSAMGSPRLPMNTATATMPATSATCSRIMLKQGSRTAATGGCLCACNHCACKHVLHHGGKTTQAGCRHAHHCPCFIPRLSILQAAPAVCCQLAGAPLPAHATCCRSVIANINLGFDVSLLR